MNSICKFSIFAIIIFIVPLALQAKDTDPLGIEKYVSEKTRLEIEKQLESMNKERSKNPSKNIEELAKSFNGIRVGGNILTGANFDRPNGISEATPKFHSNYDPVTKTGTFDLQVSHHFVNSAWDYSVVRYEVKNGVIQSAYKMDDSAFQPQIYSAEPQHQTQINRNIAAIHEELVKYCELENGRGALLNKFKEITNDNISGSFQDNIEKRFDFLKSKYAEAIRKMGQPKIDAEVSNDDLVKTHDFKTTTGIFLTFGSKPITKHLVQVNVPGYPTLFFDGKHFLTRGTIQSMDPKSTSVTSTVNADTIQCDKGWIKRHQNRVSELTPATVPPLAPSGPSESSH